jgi:hypothetical protein
MDIGTPKRKFTIEPIRDPVPSTKPARQPAPPTPATRPPAPPVPQP